MLENPFPGMNPYMENPQSWQGVHLRLIAAIDSELNTALPDEYVTQIEERVYIEGWDKYYRPDNAIVQLMPSYSSRPQAQQKRVAAAALRLWSVLQPQPLPLRLRLMTH